MRGPQSDGCQRNAALLPAAERADRLQGLPTNAEVAEVCSDFGLLNSGVPLHEHLHCAPLVWEVVCLVLVEEANDDFRLAVHLTSHWLQLLGQSPQQRGLPTAIHAKQGNASLRTDIKIESLD